MMEKKTSTNYLLIVDGPSEGFDLSDSNEQVSNVAMIVKVKLCLRFNFVSEN